MARKNNIEIVLDAMFKGITVEIIERKFCLSDDRQLCIEAESINTETNEKKKVLLGVDWSLDYFIKVTDEMTEEQIINIVHQIGSSK